MDVRTACLGVLDRGDATGYEIKKLFEEGPFSHFYEAGYGSIYPALNRLSEEGMVTFTEMEQDKRPDKKVYSITRRGRDELLRALRAYPGRDRLRSEFLFMLTLADHMPTEHVADIIDERLAWYRENIARMESCGEAGQRPAQDFVRGFGLAIYRAASAYLEENKDAFLADVAPADSMVAD